MARKQEERESKAREQAEFEYAEQQEYYREKKAALEEAAGTKPSESSRPLGSLRQEKGLSRTQLAKLTGLTFNKLWLIEAMRQAPSQAELVKLAEALGCAPEDILVKERRPPGRALKEPAIPNVECTDVKRVNLTDADSSIVKPSTSRAFLQGYNAQMATDKNQFILGAWLSTLIRDAHNLERTIEEIMGNIGARPSTVLADTGYFSAKNASGMGVLSGISLLCPPEKVPRCPAKSAPQVRLMREKLADPAVRALYNLRSVMVEPVFGQIKSNRGFIRFSMRAWRSAAASGLCSLPCTTCSRYSDLDSVRG